MKIQSIETLHCDAGWRPWTFIKITTDKGVVGYSECTDSHGSPHGMAGVIKDLEKLLLGKDPNAVETRFWEMFRATRQSPGSIVQKAIGGIENALLDIKGKSLGVPVYELLGGPLWDRLRVYWSHCGTTRVRAASMVGENPVRNLRDVAQLGREVVERGFTALKTNMLVLEDAPFVHMPGFGKGSLPPERNITPMLIDHVVSVIATLRDAVGPDTGICLDLNFNFRTEGNIKMARALEQFDLMWLEVDSYDADAVRDIQQATSIPICSGENLYTASDFRPYFEKHAMQIAMVDVPWNGLLQSKKIADMAEIYDMSVAPHNYYSHLATLISAHFCALVPNFRILEVDVDDVPWKDDLITTKPAIANGYMELPTGPGWGADLNETVLNDHPWPAL